MKLNKLIITTIVILIIATLLVFYPLFNLKSSVKDTQSNVDYVVNWYNPFKPKITSITKLSDEDGYWVIVSDYQRTGLFEYTYIGEVNGIKKPIDLGLVNATITNKTLEEVKQIVTKQDLSKTQYVPEKSDALKEYETEQTKAPECQRILDYGLQENTPNIDIITRLYKNQTLREIKQFIAVKGVGESRNVYIYNIPVNDKSIIKLRLFFNNVNWEDENQYLNNSLIKATKVYNDCREEEIILPEKQ